MSEPKQESSLRELSLREYARKEGITLQSAYRRIWEGRVIARKMYDRWFIPDRQPSEGVPV